MNQSAREERASLRKVALGEEYADIVIKNATLVNVMTKEFIDNQSIAIKGSRIAYVGSVDQCIGPTTEVINAQGKYVSPGLMDGHMHVESTMLSVTEFAKVALEKGTTSIFMDPHEIANVLGAQGVRLMHEEGQNLPLHVFTTFPSCVPATSDLEDAGAELHVKDIEEGLRWEGVVGLGEVMNFPGVVYNDPKMIGEIEATMAANQTVTGHFPDGTNEMLQAYIASGVDSCHETVARQQALEKARLGMHVMVREGSAWHDVEEVIKIVTEDGVDSTNVSLVTDDVYPQTLVEKGQLNHVVRRAMEEGVDPVEAIQMATINVARYYHMDKERGSVTPGKIADIIIFDDLATIEPDTVITKGQVVVANGQLIFDMPAYHYPAEAKDTVKLPRPLTAEDFLLQTNQKQNVEINGIRVIENNARTEQFTATLDVKNGVVQPDLDQDIVHLACIDRHHQSGDISLGFAQGFQLKTGAVASTVGHDSHNLLVMGINPEDMQLAANELAKSGGGMIVVDQGKVLAHVPMPIAGLMSDEPLDVVVEQVRQLEDAWKQLGCPIHAPFMTFSLIALPVIPDIRISNRGLVDVTKFELIDVIRN
ncbi:adenine deaminase [Gracilibacillus halophilus YIM-C55.5]|uniref:Adenine deaminase n=1 Tax=Gracilibacillus halophilus YIM-C55.5 TaxID=1308866 RepID=N4WEP8_9BACI|nr:adenine deaminase [Gracilibacillus halophilus]ENH97734.1 adenine deaminase [Gracilibacillus halophilus YIM-C55.5]